MSIIKYCILLLAFNGTAQDVFFKSNLNGEHVITYSDQEEVRIDVNAQNTYKIRSSKRFVIEFTENSSTIAYQFLTADFDDNDTIYFNFFGYSSSDTVHFSAACIDGSEAENNVSILEKGKGFSAINELPNEISLILRNGELVFTKSVESYVIVSSRNGMRAGLRWGFSESTISRRVIYSTAGATKK